MKQRQINETRRKTVAYSKASVYRSSRLPLLSYNIDRAYIHSRGIQKRSHGGDESGKGRNSICGKRKSRQQL